MRCALCGGTWYPQYNCILHVAGCPEVERDVEVFGHGGELELIERPDNDHAVD